MVIIKFTHYYETSWRAPAAMKRLSSILSAFRNTRLSGTRSLNRLIRLAAILLREDRKSRSRIAISRVRNLALLRRSRLRDPRECSARAERVADHGGDGGYRINVSESFRSRIFHPAVGRKKKSNRECLPIDRRLVTRDRGGASYRARALRRRRVPPPLSRVYEIRFTETSRRRAKRILVASCERRAVLRASR